MSLAECESRRMLSAGNSMAVRLAGRLILVAPLV